MKQTLYGLLLYVFLLLPTVAALLESIMIMHMHMQMSLLAVSGFLMARFFQLRFPAFFAKWNRNGVPGIMLFVIIWIYWMIPRTMDEALTMKSVEWFKFISLPFLAGVPLSDSWKKLAPVGKKLVYFIIAVSYLISGWIYATSQAQLCNNYMIVEQKELGWGSMAIAVCLFIYLLQLMFTDQSEYQ